MGMNWNTMKWESGNSANDVRDSRMIEGYTSSGEYKAYQAGRPESPDNYGYTEGGLAFLKGNSDSEINAINQQSLWNREDMIRRLAEIREDYSMDRIVAAAKRNGINPVFLMDALSGNTVGNAASYTTSAAKANSYDTNAKTEAANSAKIIGAILTAIGMVVAAAM